MIPQVDPVETAELAAFVRASEVKSLTRAAAELGIPRATLSRRLARLEERLGTRLLRRTTRSVAFTGAGEVFYQRARQVLEALADAEASVRRRDNVMRGEVRISVPPLLMHESFSSMITAFARKHPGVRVHVDFSSRIVDLHSERYDAALRGSCNIDRGLIARVVGKHKVIAVASPAYLTDMGTPNSVKDLRNHRCITGFSTSPTGDPRQSTWPAGKGVAHVEGAFSSNDIVLRREAAARGMGITLVPDILVEEHLETGTLVQVLAGIVEAESRLAVVYVERSFLAPHVRAFIEALVEWAPGALRPPQRGPQGRSLSRARR